MISKGRDADIANWSLELDQRMSTVVRIRRARLAAGTEVGIMADCALVPVTLDVCLSTIALVAQRAITIYAMMACFVAV
jgi:hypothetical protein